MSNTEMTGQAAANETRAECLDNQPVTITLTAEELAYVKGQAARGPHGGLYDLPYGGAPLRLVRRFFDDMAPQPGDRIVIKVGKNVLRYATVVAVAGAAVTVVF